MKKEMGEVKPEDSAGGGREGPWLMERMEGKVGPVTKREV